MPRKRRNKKDPLAQKLDFEEEHDQPSKGERLKQSNLISQYETDLQNAVFHPPEADALPTASEQPMNAMLIPTDFAHRDRLRFTRPGGSAAVEESEDYGSPTLKRFLVLCMCLICLILIVQWLKTEGYNVFLKCYQQYMNEFSNMEADGNKDSNLLSYFSWSATGFVCSLLLSFLFGASCLFFSCGITYHDSLQPGQFPPSPVSPKKYRKESGHTFHSSYAMALINGVAVFAFSAWWLFT